MFCNIKHLYLTFTVIFLYYFLFKLDIGLCISFHNMLSLSSTFNGLEAFAIDDILIFYYSMQMLEIKLFQTK